MKLSSRKELIEEADNELQNIKNIIKNKEIKSQADWEKFEKDESLAIEFSDKWKEQIKDLAKKGRISIDLDKLKPVDKYKAKMLLYTLESEINELETGNIFGYSQFWKVFVYLMSILSFLYAASTVVGEDDNTYEKKFIEKIKNFPSPKQTPPKNMLNWIKSLVSMIKK